VIFNYVVYPVTIIVLIVALMFGPVVVSLLIEAMRPKPPVPEKLAWAAQIPIQYATVNGYRLRFIKSGQGPNLVLLHTLRTQLDIFQKVIPALAQRFTVYAPDYPGHGYSEIPKADYDPKLFVKAVAGFLDKLAIRGATLAGISIGGTIALLLAAQHHPCVKKVVAINTYDYDKGSGIKRSSWVANLIVTFSLIPVLGETVMRFRNRLVERFIFEGGVALPDAIPAPLLEEFFIVGTRPGHYQAFLNLLRNANKWDEAHSQYANIKVPVLLVYGERDWSRPIERETTFKEIPGAKLQIVTGGKHFLSLDRPREMEQIITDFAAS
jgi:pimeloyl-ACP methyl ester carboxylesterase